jgi:predicted phage tail protein
MKQLIKRLESIKDKKIKSFKDQLQQEEKEELKSLQQQVDDLSEKIKKTEKSLATQKKQRQDFLIQTKTSFVSQTHQQELLSQVWAKTADNHFGDTKAINAWLEAQLKAALDFVESQQGKASNLVVRAGQSHAQLKKLTAKTKASLEKDEAIEEGFILVADTVEVDSRLSTYLDDLYQTHRDALLKEVKA